MTGTHQGYKFLSRSARTNLPCDQEKRDALIAATLETKPKGMTHWSCRTLGESPGSKPQHRESALAIAQSQAAPEPHLQVVARSQVHREVDRCGGFVPESAAKGDRVMRR